jgi:hypothetical protein
MRLKLTLASIVAVIGAAFTPALAGAAYTTLEARDAAACARACTDDGLCIAWIQNTQNVCALSATVPTAWPGDDATMGLSARAPSFASLPERPQGLTNITETPPVEPSPDHADTAPEPEYALLGGPEDDTLRPRLRR